MQEYRSLVRNGKYVSYPLPALLLALFRPMIAACHLGDKVTEDKTDQHGQRHQDDLRHIYLPEQQSQGDNLGVLDQDYKK